MTRLRIYLENGTSVDFSMTQDETLDKLSKMFTEHEFIVIGKKAIVPTAKILYVTMIIDDD